MTSPFLLTERDACHIACAPGTETWTRREVEALGIAVTAVEPGGVDAQATLAQIYAMNLRLRTATRVTQRLAAFTARTFKELEKKAAGVAWATVVPEGSPVRFRVTARLSALYHEKAIAERLQRAVAAAVPGAHEAKAAAEDDEAGDTQTFIVRVLHDEMTIGADTSGALLHRRGYRLGGGKAPLRETLAASLLLAAGYDGSLPLVDPLCGSGTIPIEAALIARRIAPGLLGRSFACERWPSFDTAAWREARAAAEAEVLPAVRAPIVGSDRDAGVIESALANAERAGVAADVTFAQCALSASPFPPSERGDIVTNPPYGVRIGERAPLQNLYAQLGKVVRTRAPFWSVTLLSAHPSYEAQTHLEFASLALVNNGGLRLRLAHAAAPPPRA